MSRSGARNHADTAHTMVPDDNSTSVITKGIHKAGSLPGVAKVFRAKRHQDVLKEFAAKREVTEESGQPNEMLSESPDVDESRPVQRSLHQ